MFVAVWEPLSVGVPDQSTMSSSWRRGVVGAGVAIVFLSVVVAVVGVGFGAGVGVVEANETRSDVVQGSADLDVTLPDNQVEAGETETLEFFIANDGEVETRGRHPPEAIDRATEARSVRIDVDDTRDAPIDVSTGEQFVGTIESGESSGPQGFEVSVDDDADPGEYTIDVDVTYRDARNVYYTQYPDGDIDFDEDVRRRSETFQMTVEVQDEARFEITNVTHGVSVDDSGVLAVDVENTGTEPINDTVVTATASDQDFFFGSGGASSDAFVGDWAPGETKTIEYRAGTSEEAIRKFYTVEFAIDYSDSDGEDLQEALRTGVQPHAKQWYEVVDVDHDVAVGDDGVLAVDVRNAGPRDVTEAAVTVNAEDQAIVFGSGTVDEPISAGEFSFEPQGAGSPTSEAFVGDWGAGETVRLYYRTGATDDALERNYSVDVTVEGRDTDGNDLTSRTRTIGLRPLPEQTFSIDDVESSLYVGEDGTLEGTVTNTGERGVENVVVLYDSDVSNLFPRETQYAVGSLDPGESTDFRFRIGASEDAEAGPRQLELTTRYRNHRGESRLTDPTDVFATVESERDEFALRPANATLEPGEAARIEIELENTYDETLRNVRAKLFTNSPLSSDDDEVFLTEIAPGETDTIVFEVSASGGAVPKTYPLSIDFRYDDERDETRLSDTYRVPVQVVESDDPAVPVWLVVLLLVIAGAVAWRYRDRLPGRDRLRGGRNDRGPSSGNR